MRIGFVPEFFGTKLKLKSRRRSVWSDQTNIRETLETKDRLQRELESEGVFDWLPLEQFGLVRRLLVEGLGWAGISIEQNERSEPVYSSLLSSLAQRVGQVDAFGYDWTRSALETAKLFGEWIRNKTNEEANSPPWLLIGHGFGGLVLASWLVTGSRQDLPISAIVLCGTPLLGSAKALSWALRAERDFSLLLQPVLDRVGQLDTHHYTELYRNMLRMESFRELLPPVSDDCVRLPKKMTTLSDVLADLPSDIKRDWRSSGLEEWLGSSGWASTIDRDALVQRACAGWSIDLFCVGSASERTTPSMLLIGDERSEVIEYQGGDGVVTLRSALAGAKQDNQLILEGRHSEIIMCDDFLSYIDDLLKRLPR